MIFDVWKEVCIGDVVTNFDNKRKPLSSIERRKRQGEFPYYGAASIIDFIDNFIYDGEYVLIAEDGSVIDDKGHPIVQITNGKFWVSNHSHVLKGNRIIDTWFLYYLLKNIKIKPYITGSVQLKLSQTNLNRIPLRLPPIYEQVRIVLILKSLDKKIELNNKIIKNFEEITRSLFKSWFIDFEPFKEGQFIKSELGLIPSGWFVSTIGEIALVIDCLHSKKPILLDNGYPYLQLENILSNGKLDTNNVMKISEIDYQKWTSRVEVRGGDCVITNVGRVGAVAQIPEGYKAAIGRNMTCIRCKESFDFPTFLLECLISESMRSEINLKTDSGTILNSLNVRNIPKLRFIHPNYEVLVKFEKISRTIRKQVDLYLEENSSLVILRDTLLSKLISGEIRVPLEEASYEDVR